MPKAKKKSVKKNKGSSKKNKSTSKKSDKISAPKKSEKVRVKEPARKTPLAPFIILAVVGILLIALFVIVYILYSFSMESSAALAAGDNIKEAGHTGDLAAVSLSDDVNLNEVMSVELVFSDGENQYVYSATDITSDYEVYASDLGLESFQGIVSVSAAIIYYEPETPDDTQAPAPTRTPTTPPPSSGGGSGGGGGGTGGGDDGGDEGCTDECPSPGLFCDGNRPYNCTKPAGGCLEKQYLDDCLQGEECKNGECVPAQCSSDENCTSDGCYSGEYRNYYCNSSSYCDYHDITKIENLTNNNCNNSIDDDCDGLFDMDDSGCQSVPGCGNNILETNETCDSTDLGGKTCQDFGYENGTLRCCFDCLNFDLSQCYNITYGTCYDWDSGLDYETPSNATQASIYDCGPVCPNTTGGGGCGQGDDGISFDSCEGTILTEYFCNSTTERIDSVEYDCALINKTCELGACVGAGTCGNRYCEGGSQRLIHEGESVTTVFNGKDYNVSLIEVISKTLADIMVNSNTQAIEEGYTYNVENLPIYVIDVTYGSLIDKTGNATLFLGENEITCPTDCASGSCGNDAKEAGEVCDGTDLDGKTCRDFGYDEGNLSCCEGCDNFNFVSCMNVNKSCTDPDGEDYYTSSKTTFNTSWCNGSVCGGTGDFFCGSMSISFNDTCNGTVLKVVFEEV
jgi:hypothetical protein